MQRTRSHRHQFAQIWLLQAGVVAFAFYVIVDRSYLQTMFEADQSYLSSVILLVFLCASGHAAWYILRTSSCIEESLDAVRGEALSAPPPSLDTDPGTLRRSARMFVRNYIHDLTGERSADSSSGTSASDTSYILEVYADSLRSPVELGWYLVDILIRLGLIGTIIGFILILGALADGPAPTGDNIQALLISMSGGMGTALYTTLAGLIAGTLLGLQYSVLSRSVERQIGLLIQIRNRTLSGATG
jgi:hypothetical protein